MSPPPYQWMKKLRIKSQLAREFLAELLGTFILIMYGDAAFAGYGLEGKGVGDVFAITWAWGVGVILGIATAGGLTGGHINPAVTLALATLGKLPWKKVPVYIFAQHLGAFLASALIFFNFWEGLNLFSGHHRYTSGPKATAYMWTTMPRENISLGTIFLDNLVGTGLLMLTAMATIDKRNMKFPPYFHPIIIGFMICATALSFGFNCMAPLNPARDFATRLFIAIAGWGSEPFSPIDYQYWWIAGLLGPHLGAIIGAWIYYLCIELHWPDEEEELNDLQSKQIMPNERKERMILLNEYRTRNEL